MTYQIPRETEALIDWKFNCYCATADVNMGCKTVL